MTGCENSCEFRGTSSKVKIFLLLSILSYGAVRLRRAPAHSHRKHCRFVATELTVVELTPVCRMNGSGHWDAVTNPATTRRLARRCIRLQDHHLHGPSHRQPSGCNHDALPQCAEPPCGTSCKPPRWLRRVALRVWLGAGGQQRWRQDSVATCELFGHAGRQCHADRLLPPRTTAPRRTCRRSHATGWRSSAGGGALRVAGTATVCAILWRGDVRKRHCPSCTSVSPRDPPAAANVTVATC